MDPLAWTLATIAALVPQTLLTRPTLTILPLGDSITWGFASSDGNGYRLRLSSFLTDAGLGPFVCDIPAPQPGQTAPSSKYCTAGKRSIGHAFVGSQTSGDMLSNRNEGHNAFAISQIQDVATPVLQSYCAAHPPRGITPRPWDRPDVVLLMAGTNDMVLNPLGQDASQAPARLANLIDMVTLTCPDAAVLVTRIVATNDSMPAGVAGGEARVRDFNTNLSDIVAAFEGEGRNVSLVDRGEVVGGNDLVDGVHPTEEGYRRIGEAWWEGMQETLPIFKHRQ